MKNLKYLFISLLAVLFIACEDDFEMPKVTEPVQGTAPVLNALTEEIDLVLEKKNEGSIIVDLMWTDATYADPIGVRYYVQVDTVGNEFKNALEFDRVSDTKTSITVGGLNTLISSRYAPAKMVDLEARIRAFANEDLQSLYSASFTMKVTPYLDVPIPSDLFIFGTSTASAEVTDALKAYGKENIFTKYLKLTKDGLFKFSDKQADDGYDYNFGKFATVSDNIEAAADDAGNFKFTGETGWYAVTADFVNSNLTIAAYESYVGDYPNIYLVGDYNATDPAWSPGTSPEMTRKSEGVYSIEVTLKDGANFKFINQQNWDGLDWADADSDGNTGIIAPKGKNNNIAFDGADKTYIVTLDLNKGIYTVEEAAIYLVGDATEAGWNIDNAIELKYRSSHNAYMGYIPLKSGNFKFFPAKGSWDGGMGRITDTEDPKGGLLGGDNKDIPSTNTGDDFKLYRIAVWFDADASSYKYSVLDAEMILVGDATPAGWSIDNGFNMVYAGEGKWTTYVDMNATGGFKFFYETGNWDSGYKEISAGELSLEGGDPNIATPGEGYYKLTMDTYNMTYTKDLIADKKMFLVGSPNGWNINAGIEMTWDDTNKEWTLTTDLAADDAFKIFAESGNWDSGFKFKYEMLNFEGGDPNLSTPDGAGNYTIKFSLAKRTLTFTKN
ncbi:SusF/SusE family outer membrane protein [Ancylomarina euxinus]|uniref:SusF/SusE family outer membrane protein n=1 Tax=Ancylomarina euxinus TaxID=2283627 RepID=A0A425XXM1_9BACT|nr:SusF/SusE family outer membrane protein [Ancylomarina euxinus]MCZ4694736.1 SusF/SusE family outer membrane protein [Ancylomarina euxinus]MUP16400.1 SusF/SusE family outer membrane protein [Ancylomarina euxinus]RRG19431.1 SusF/SusE family outer membrane protein [Ancylomarina euxinus]